MARERRSWLRGCAVICGVLVLIPLAIVLAITFRTCAPLSSASRDLARLEERFGPPEAFAPAPAGGIPADRILAFLRVREAMMGPCESFRDLTGRMERVERLDEEPVSGREVADTTRDFAGVATGIAPMIGEFFEQRNRSLLEVGMGLGEYSYIFAMAYRDRLLDEITRRELFSEGGSVSPEAQSILRAILARQLDAALAAGGEEDSRRALEREIRALELDPARLPWRDGLPDAVAASLAPYRDRLEEAFCPVTAGIALDPGSRRALIIALY